jgi:hypothetical protein
LAPGRLAFDPIEKLKETIAMVSLWIQLIVPLKKTSGLLFIIALTSLKFTDFSP